MADTAFSWDRLGHHISESLKSLTGAVEKLEVVIADLQKVSAAMTTKVEAQQQEIRDLRAKVESLKEEVAVLKFKSGMWGALAGITAAIGSILIQKLK